MRIHLSIHLISNFLFANCSMIIFLKQKAQIVERLIQVFSIFQFKLPQVEVGPHTRSAKISAIRCSYYYGRVLLIQASVYLSSSSSLLSGVSFFFLYLSFSLDIGIYIRLHAYPPFSLTSFLTLNLSTYPLTPSLSLAHSISGQTRRFQLISLTGPVASLDSPLGCN